MGSSDPTAEPPPGFPPSPPSLLPWGKKVRAVPCRYFFLCEKFFSLRALIPTRFPIFHPSALLALRACPRYGLRPSRTPVGLGAVPPAATVPQGSPLLHSLPGSNERRSLPLLGEGSGTGCCTGSIPKARRDLLHPDLARPGQWHFGRWYPASRQGPVLAPPDQETAF